MEYYTAYEVLADVLQKWDLMDLYYFDFYKSDNTVKYGRKGENYERHMEFKEFSKLINVITILGKSDCIDIYD